MSFSYVTSLVWRFRPQIQKYCYVSRGFIEQTWLLGETSVLANFYLLANFYFESRGE